MTKYDVEKQKWNKKASMLQNNATARNITATYNRTFFERNILKPVARYFDLRDNNKTILDVGCGMGWTTMALAEKAKSVCCLDISFNRVKILDTLIKDKHVCNIVPTVGDAEYLPFKEEGFDYVFGYAALHHLDLDPALSEVRRILKDTGKAAFCEPFGHNPLINFYRFVKHNYIEEIKGTDRPLKYSDKAVFERYFRRVQFLEVSFSRDKIPWLRPLEAKVLNAFPFLRRWVCYVTILLQK